jgi:hypothetical protein
MQLWKRFLDLAVSNRLTFPDGTVIDAKVPRCVGAGSAKTLTREDGGRTILLDTAAGSTVTLPRATGSGAIYRFLVSALATSNSHIIKVGNTTDTMAGALVQMTDTTNGVLCWFAVAGTSDTITLNRSTTGSVTIGEHIEITDYAAGKFHVRGVLSGTGTEATPFSATV